MFLLRGFRFIPEIDQNIVTFTRVHVHFNRFTSLDEEHENPHWLKFFWVQFTGLLLDRVGTTIYCRSVHVLFSGLYLKTFVAIVCFSLKTIFSWQGFGRDCTKTIQVEFVLWLFLFTFPWERFSRENIENIELKWSEGGWKSEGKHNQSLQMFGSKNSPTDLKLDFQFVVFEGLLLKSWKHLKLNAGDLRQTLWLLFFGTLMIKEIKQTLHLEQMFAVWCGLDSDDVFFWSSAFRQSLCAERLRHFWGVCAGVSAGVRGATVQTAAWPSTLWPKPQAACCGCAGPREQRGSTKKQTNSGIKVGLGSHLAAFANNSVQTSLKWWKTQNGGRGWGLRRTWPYRAVIIRLLMLCGSRWPRTLKTQPVNAAEVAA